MLGQPEEDLVCSCSQAYVLFQDVFLPFSCFRITARLAVRIISRFYVLDTFNFPLYGLPIDIYEKRILLLPMPGFL
jgi:hypothetical protein